MESNTYMHTFEVLRRSWTIKNRIKPFRTADFKRSIIIRETTNYSFKNKGEDE